MHLTNVSGHNGAVSDVLLTCMLTFFLILNNNTNFTRNRVCSITSPLPVGEI